MSSEVLRRFTNAADLPGISIAHYWVDTADVHGLPQVLSVSENFKAGNEKPDHCQHHFAEQPWSWVYSGSSMTATV